MNESREKNNPFFSKLPTKFQKKLVVLKNYLAPYTKRVYIVGGSVRDMLLDIKVKDLDIEVYDIEPEIFDEIMSKLGAVGVGKSFFVYKWSGFDISLPRLEKKVSFGHKGFEVTLCQDEKEASKRRDFTMNALMVDLFEGKIKDFWQGIDDIKNKTIKIVDKKRFKEDSLRVFRAMQFSSRLGFRIEKNSLKVMCGIDLGDLSKERVFWEFEKMFNSKFLHYGLYYMLKLEIAKKIFGIEVDRSLFLKTALELQKNRLKFEKEFYPYYFLYIVSKNFGLKYDFLATILKAPNSYKKFLSKQADLPQRITDRFLLKLSLRYPLREWLGNYANGVKKRAKELGVYDKCYDGGIFAKDIISDGYEGSQIGKELERRRIKKIEEEF